MLYLYYILSAIMYNVRGNIVTSFLTTLPEMFVFHVQNIYKLIPIVKDIMPYSDDLPLSLSIYPFIIL